MTQDSPDSNQSLTETLFDAALESHTKAATRLILLLFCQSAISQGDSKDDLVNTIINFMSRPKGGLHFIIHHDVFLGEMWEWEVNRDAILEAFKEEMNSFVEVLDSGPQQTKEDGSPPNDYSRLYGKDSAWN